MDEEQSGFTHIRNGENWRWLEMRIGKMDAGL
jgi:hypothetical protein